MRIINARFLVLLVFLTLSGCGPKPASTRLQVALPQETELSQHLEYSRDQSAMRVIPDRGFDVLLYSLEGAFDWSRMDLMGQVAIHFQANRKISKVVLDSQVTEISRVWDASGRDLAFSVDTKANELSILLASEMEAGQNSRIHIQYIAHAWLFARGGLAAITERAGDPNKSRVVYSFSEPTSAAVWMPCHDVPSDRAKFEALFRMERDESLISNGRLTFDQVGVDGKRVMKYVTDFSMPTYLMAFALGQFTHSETYLHGLPISVWARVGANVDYDGLLRVTKDQISHFEKLLGPYPWEKYAVVLIPDFGGGIEHASITFNCEDCSSNSNVAGDVGLMAHELGHQWFGDYVTVKDWDDLWIKEGMATLLAAEFMGRYGDLKNVGRKNGDSFYPVEGDAIIDPTLPPPSKYTSGPYARAAWFYTQIRYLAGEEVFWRTLRTFLSKNAYGNFSSQQLLAEFIKIIPAEVGSRLEAVLYAKSTPKLEVEEVIINDQTHLNVRVIDPEKTLLSPLRIRKFQGDTVSDLLLEPTVTAQWIQDEKTFLALDPDDVQPRLEALISSDKISDAKKLLESWVRPRSEGQWRIWRDRLPASQELLLSLPRPWAGHVNDFRKSYGELSSQVAQYYAIRAGCLAAKQTAEDSSEGIAWKAVLNDLSLTPPYLGINGRIDLGECAGVISAGGLAALYKLMIHDPSSPMLSEDVLVWLLRYPLTAETLPSWSSLLQNGRSYRARLIASNVFYNWIQNNPGTVATSGMHDAIATIMRVALANSEVKRIVGTSRDLLTKLKDPQAVPIFAKWALLNELTEPTRISFICGAFKASTDEKGQVGPGWQKFVNEFSDKALSASLQSALNAPATNCK